ncbi:MAG: transporter substrate-binding domain-containing protein [Bosea sp.]|jgi:polar amino acid transport system substrate-binding protein|uniref:transporter substrate-binding domain-containing protein n=1 Tax=Hyphomicrobiales TaxID=356 RepID=UPI00083747E7|nr:MULTISPECIES: transporter substrate-binding domain-containing protein [Hyphomicrobiales]MCP4561829.1 transporter substrate-binding domain-containing protein [Bosea sp. (in: a-proteobacteria)]MCP4738210.1 transporter substrate-binding domain-containing protein [Bosea sp. (in: a-proteobacteria)]MDX3804834.1 transporter substrate-binding domain-containing protein [Bosea sp. (in: a-proteobacteria)]
MRRFFTSALGALALAALMVMGLVTDAGAQAPAPSQLQTVLARGKLIVGTRSSAIGFSFKDQKGELAGFDIDLARLLAQQIFKDPSKVELVVLSGSADRVPALVSGRVDAVISSFSPYPERVQVIDFSAPYALSDTVFVVRADSPFQKNADLVGKTVLTRQGADLEQMINGSVPGTKIEGFPELSDAFLAFRQGRGDAFFYERAAAYYLMKGTGGRFRVIDDKANPIAASGISIGLKQGDQVWINYINWLLYDLKANNKLQALHQKWFETDALQPSWVKQPL